jgi:hypothetical protein
MPQSDLAQDAKPNLYPWHARLNLGRPGYMAVLSPGTVWFRVLGPVAADAPSCAFCRLNFGVSGDDMIAPYTALSSDSAGWRKSSFCQTGECAEFRQEDGDGEILLRSSRSPDAIVRFTRAEWAAFLQGVDAGEFDLGI